MDLHFDSERSRRRGLAWVAACIAGGLLSVPAPAAALDYTIRGFQVDLQIEPNGGLRVLERIEVDFSSPRHGIYRVIPVREETRTGFVRDLRLTFESAVDPEGRVLRARARRDGNRVRIQVGDPNRTVSGHQTYLLRYRVRNGIDYHDDHDELYWNVTGDEWPVPIDFAMARVLLPSPVKEEQVSWSVYTGAHGERGGDATVGYAPGSLEVRTTQQLPAWSGVTVAFGWPKGIVREPGPLALAGDFLRWNWPLFLPIPVGLWVWRRWRKRGRDPRTGQAVAVQYEPPAGLTAAEVGTLIDERVDMQDVTAAVIDLAVRGHLRIEQQARRMLGIFDGQTYTLVKLAAPAGAPPLKPHEQSLLDGLFASGDSVRLDELRQRFYTHLPRIRRDVYNELVRVGLFEASPESVRRRWLGLGVIVLVGGVLFCVYWVRQQGLVSPQAILPPLAGVVASAIILLGVARAMPRRTRKGVEQTLWIRGLEEFIRRVESHRLEMQERAGFDARTQFERVLPFAMALGVGSRWAAAFADLYTEPPSWYSGPMHDGFSAPRFVSGLESMRGHMASDMTAAPRSSGGGSGLGGGGSSGGGHGGGGGGAW